MELTFFFDVGDSALCIKQKDLHYNSDIICSVGFIGNSDEAKFIEDAGGGTSFDKRNLNSDKDSLFASYIMENRDKLDAWLIEESISRGIISK